MIVESPLALFLRFAKPLKYLKDCFRLLEERSNQSTLAKIPQSTPAQMNRNKEMILPNVCPALTNSRLKLTNNPNPHQVSKKVLFYPLLARINHKDCIVIY